MTTFFMMNDKKAINTTVLVQKFKETGDRECFEQLYNKYADIAFRKCLSYLKSKEDAEDTTQEIWVKVFFALPKFEQKSSFSTWLYRITTNQCITALKRQKVFVSLNQLSDEGFDVKDEQEDIFSIISDKHQVTKALSLLSKDMKALLLMKYVDEYTYEEVAEATGLGESAVKMRIARAKKRLRAALSNEVV